MEIKELHQLFLSRGSVSTDTRKINPEAVFFALKGDNFNGNRFAQQALDSGASYAVIDDKAFQTKCGRTILVEDTLITLQQLANYHREYLGIPVIALTGSNGKTTTKELINAVLSQSFKTTATKGNLNNHIGVPLTLLSMNDTTEMGIVEMGANHFGEIEQLCEIAKPDYGYITNFGKAHLEGFGSLEGVIKAKTELYTHLKKNDKTIFINTDDAVQRLYQASGNTFLFGTNPEGNNLSVKLVNANPLVSVAVNDIQINSSLIGIYNFSNIAAAVAIGLYFKISASSIKKGIESYLPENNRSQIVEKNSNTILLDAYNANPTSMRAAIENFIRLEQQNKVLVIGDMFELGSEAATEHQTIADFIEQQDFEKVFLIGKSFFEVKAGGKIQKSETFEDFSEKIKNQIPKNSCILIKGSRGMALERTLDLL